MISRAYILSRALELHRAGDSQQEHKEEHW